MLTGPGPDPSRGTDDVPFRLVLAGLAEGVPRGRDRDRSGGSGEPKERRVTMTGSGGSGEPKERRVTMTGSGGSGEPKERRVTMTGSGGSGEPKDGA